MWLRENRLKAKIAHFRLLSASQKRACLSSLKFWRVREERRSVERGGRLSPRGGWMRGKGPEYALRLYFHLRKIGRVSIKIHLYPYSRPDYFCDLN